MSVAQTCKRRRKQIRKDKRYKPRGATLANPAVKPPKGKKRA